MATSWILGYHQSSGQMFEFLYSKVKKSLNPLKNTKFTSLIVVFLALSACENLQMPKPDPVKEKPERETIFGPGGLTDFLDTDTKQNRAGSGRSIGVNVFLWRATLDTMSVWPILSADPFGGVVITDWYAPPETPNERFKMNIYILDRALRADGVRVSVFRQIRSASNSWRDASVRPGTARKLEEAILMRARQFRIQMAN